MNKKTNGTIFILLLFTLGFVHPNQTSRFVSFAFTCPRRPGALVNTANPEP
jgi:hypothetical protein